MRNKIKTILEQNYTSKGFDLQQATDQLLILYGVGCSSCEDIPKESYYPGMTCKECNQPFRIVKNKQ